VLDVGALLEQIRAIMAKATGAVEFVFMFTLAAGFVVLCAALQATQAERLYDCTIMKTLGASRRVIAQAIAAEFTALGLCAGLIGAGGAWATGWLLAHRVMHVDYGFQPWLFASGITFASRASSASASTRSSVRCANRSCASCAACDGAGSSVQALVAVRGPRWADDRGKAQPLAPDVLDPLHGARGNQRGVARPSSAVSPSTCSRPAPARTQYTSMRSRRWRNVASPTATSATASEYGSTQSPCAGCRTSRMLQPSFAMNETQSASRLISTRTAPSPLLRSSRRIVARPPAAGVRPAHAEHPRHDTLHRHHRLQARRRDPARRTGLQPRTPQAPSTAAVRRYLAEFLADPRIVELPRALWLPILHGIILNIRPRRSAHAYQQIWTAQGSPLMVHSEAQRDGLAARLAGRVPGGVIVALGMRYGEPSIASALRSLAQANVRRVLVLPLYPQYSAPSTASVLDAVSLELMRWRWVPNCAPSMTITTTPPTSPRWPPRCGNTGRRMDAGRSC